MFKPAELLYRGINRARRALYRAGVLQGKRLPKPVISVGNIAAGGAGKTPAVIAIARLLTDRGLKVAVLTRGYGRASTEQGPVTSLDAARFGDEPVLIKKSVPNANVIVGSNRHENARDIDADVFVLDDGFQHLRLARDLDIVIDVPDARFSREGRSALRHADLVIPRQLRTTLPPNLGRVFAFAALADNEQFFRALREAGVDVIGTRGFPDHHRYTAADLDALRRDANGATLVTTEKDAVKIGDDRIAVAGAEFVLPAEVRERVLLTTTNQEMRRGKRRKGALLQRVEYIAYRTVARAIVSMSDRSIHAWGARLGTLARKVLRKRDRLAMRNLHATFPQRDAHELRRILNDCWRHFGRELLVALQMQNLSLDEIAARCPFEGSHFLDDAIARGKGTILISAHWGGWEVAGLALMSRVRNVRTVARPLDNELLERDLQKIRAKTGASMIDRRRAARALMKGLSENATIVLLPDQAVQPREGVLVPFLGRPAWTTPAPAKMALKAGSTIVFGFCIPDGLRHRVEFVGSIAVDELPEAERDAVALTTRINDVIARRIESRPDLWLWMHDRWKGTGEGKAADVV
ncbi:MAG TPA: tetraacyldisaccharide 4'-kinase [Thermoanaerobaculia bacterium]|nr:tetraacyldisaccharide 4'-kinase [Thermoanaerobaculia bacterium]